MITQRRRELSESIGIQAEAKFVAACHAKGYMCKRSESQDNYGNHIDFYVKRPNDIISVDVKGNNFAQYIWVEFKNVKGDKGWLFGGADYIAFDMIKMNFFVVVKRSELERLCRTIVKMEFVPKHEALHKLYNREGRMDAITRITLDDLTNLKSFTILKYAEENPSA